jgi:MYXO-CTERM domain-containing protein
VRGEAAISADLYTDQPGYVWVSDACVLPSERGGPRELTLRARWRTFAATAELAWEGVAGTAEDDAEFEPDPNCQGGCGCTSAPPPSGAGALLGLAAAITARRRRRAA